MWRLREAARPLLGLPKLSSEDLATYPATTSGARICRRTASSSRSQTCTRPRLLAQASIRTTSDLYVHTEIEDIAARMAELEVAQQIARQAWKGADQIRTGVPALSTSYMYVGAPLEG